MAVPGADAGSAKPEPTWLAGANGRRVFLGGLGILLAVLAGQAFLKSGSEWVEVYVAAGSRLIGGQPVYLPRGNFVYPPFMAMIAAPFASADEIAARAVWFLASAVALVVLLRCCWSLAALPEPGGARGWSRRELVAIALGLACGATYLLNAFAHQQIDVIIAALLIAGCLQLTRGRDLRAGLLIGIAAACKATPLVWVPYLLWRRRWTAAAASFLVALALNLAPDAIGTRAAEPEPRLLTWVSQVVLPAQEIGSPLGLWYSDLIYNQSLGGTLERLVNTRLEIGSDRAMREAPTVPNAMLKLVCYAILAALFAFTAFVAGRPSHRSIAPGAPDRFAFEHSALLALMLLLSPMSSAAHFGVLLLPGLCLARVALLDGSRIFWAILIACGVLGVAMNGDLAGDFLDTLLLWSGAITLVTLLLWAGSAAVLLRTKKPAPDEAPARVSAARG